MKAKKDIEELVNAIDVDGANEILRLAFNEAIKEEGYANAEDYVAQRLSNEVVLSEIDELKLDLGFSLVDNHFLKLELEKANSKLASIPPAPVMDITTFNSMMQYHQAQSNNLLEIKEMVKTLVDKPDAKANVAPVASEVKEILTSLATDLKPTIKFFAERNEPVQHRISKKERERIEFEEYEKSLEMNALSQIKNGSKK